MCLFNGQLILKSVAYQPAVLDGACAGVLVESEHVTSADPTAELPNEYVPPPGQVGVASIGKLAPMKSVRAVGAVLVMFCTERPALCMLVMFTTHAAAFELLR